MTTECSRKNRCYRCHTCGGPYFIVLDGEEWCPACAAYQRPWEHGWPRGSRPPQVPPGLERRDTLLSESVHYPGGGEVLLADSIGDAACEWDEGGLSLTLSGHEAEYALRVLDPEQLYDVVRAAVLPWLMEREAAFAEFPRNAFRCNPDESVSAIHDELVRLRDALARFLAETDESVEMADAYALDDPKHPTYHERMSAIHDEREGK